MRARLAMRTVSAGAVCAVAVALVPAASAAASVSPPTVVVAMSKTAITFNTGATLQGRALAETAAIVFDGSNAITNP